MAKSILFVCTGNTCRSAMAGPLFLAELASAGQAGMEWLVETGGLRAGRGQSMAAGAQKALARRGLDGSWHRSKPLEDVALELYDLIVVMEPGQKVDLLARFPEVKGKAFTLGELSGSDEAVGDPYLQDDEAYERTARQIESLLASGMSKIQALCR